MRTTHAVTITRKLDALACDTCGAIALNEEPGGDWVTRGTVPLSGWIFESVAGPYPGTYDSESHFCGEACRAAHHDPYALKA